jgi:hypothetical protein
VSGERRDLVSELPTVNREERSNGRSPTFFIERSRYLLRLEMPHDVTRSRGGRGEKNGCEMSNPA